jgi:hypothetical protein
MLPMKQTKIARLKMVMTPVQFRRAGDNAGPYDRADGKETLYCIHDRTVFSCRSCDVADQSECPGFENSDCHAGNQCFTTRDVKNIATD